MSSQIELFQQVMLRHSPQRHGIMMPVGSSKKYDDRATPLTPQMLANHLSGTMTLAAPAAANGQAAVLVIDIDADALPTIYALLDAAQERGFWGWAEFHPRDDWPDEQQRGYVWISVDRLAPDAQVQLYGKQLIAAADIPDAIRSRIECRTHNSITRLPFAKHTHTGRFGIILFDDVAIDLNRDSEGGFDLWARAYKTNDTGLLPQLPSPRPTPAAARPISSPTIRPTQRTYQPRELKTHFNHAHDVAHIVLGKGGRRYSRTLIHCPCGQHAHHDRNASLLIRPSTKSEYGAYIVQGYTPTCRFYSPNGEVWDAFNVYMVLHGLTFPDMLIHARRTLNLHDALERPTSVQTAHSQGNTPPQVSQERRRAQQCSPQILPEEPAVAQAIREAILVWLICAVISPTTRKVLYYLIDQAKHHQASACKRAVPTIAQAIGCDDRTVQTSIRQLQAAGVIQVERTTNQWGGHRPNIYRLTSPLHQHPIPPAPAPDLGHDHLVQSAQEIPPQIHDILGHDHRVQSAQEGSPSTLNQGGGRSKRSPMLKACKGGELQPVETDTLQPTQPPPAAPPSESPRSEPSVALLLDDQAEGATFTPIPDGMSMREDGSVAPRGEPSGWDLDCSPKDEENCQRVRAYRAAGLLPPLPNPTPPALPPQQTRMPFSPSSVRRPPLGTQALHAEIDRLEREGRRCFAIGAVRAGKRYRAQARQLRERLAVLSRDRGGPAPASAAPPLQALKPRRRGKQTRLEVPDARNI